MNLAAAKYEMTYFLRHTFPVDAMLVVIDKPRRRVDETRERWKSSSMIVSGIYIALMVPLTALVLVRHIDDSSLSELHLLMPPIPALSL